MAWTHKHRLHSAISRRGYRPTLSKADRAFLERALATKHIAPTTPAGDTAILVVATGNLALQAPRPVPPKPIVVTPFPLVMYSQPSAALKPIQGEKAMQIKTVSVSFESTVNLGNYSNIKPAATVEAELNGQTIEEATQQLMDAARRQVAYVVKAMIEREISEWDIEHFPTDPARFEARVQSRLQGLPMFGWMKTVAPDVLAEIELPKPLPMPEPEREEDGEPYEGEEFNETNVLKDAEDDYEAAPDESDHYDDEDDDFEDEDDF